MNIQVKARIKGVLTPVITPFRSDMSVDDDKFVDQCKWLIKSGVGLAIFGTNSEATSLSLSEKVRLLDKLVAANIDPVKLMPGTGSCSLPDTVELTRYATKKGVAGVLMVPPFYYKGVTDDGLFAYFSEVVEQVSMNELKIYLYHIPAVTQVGISVGLIERLMKRYPGTFIGIKDSGGDWEATKTYIQHFSADGFDVFPGNELFMLDALRLGAAGCISATANVNPVKLVALYNNWQSSQAEALNQEIIDVRKVFQEFPVLPAMKKIIAAYKNDPSWANVRPPLVAMDNADCATLKEKLEQHDFAIRF